MGILTPNNCQVAMMPEYKTGLSVAPQKITTGVQIFKKKLILSTPDLKLNML